MSIKRTNKAHNTSQVVHSIIFRLDTTANGDFHSLNKDILKESPLLHQCKLRY